MLRQTALSFCLLLMLLGPAPQAAGQQGTPPDNLTDEEAFGPEPDDEPDLQREEPENALGPYQASPEPSLLGVVLIVIVVLGGLLWYRRRHGSLKR